ncbi:MAG: hypothetical protein AAFX04_08830 [Pseudomonadota bacterium]
MEAFFSSGRAVDVVLLVLLAEALWLKYRGGDWIAILGALMPAVLMMLALRAALTGASWPMIALPLALSFPIHLYDMRRRRVAARD